MINKRRRQSKYFAPQNENFEHKCDHPGCTKAGEYRAPKDRSLKEYYWFCLEHVQEYNSKWNYYADSSFAEPEEELKHHKFRFSSRMKYKFGFDFDSSYNIFDDISSSPSSVFTSVHLSASEKEGLKIMELDISELDVSNLKKAYKKAVKKYHPDVNTTDAAAEDKFKILSTTYKSLLSKLS